MAIAESIPTKQTNALKAMLAASATFLEWTGAEDATEAADFIYVDALIPADVDMADKRPFALIFDGAREVRRDSDGTTPGFISRDHYDIQFEANIAEDLQGDDQHEAAATAFRDAVHGIMEDVIALSGSPGYAMIASHSAQIQVQRSNPDEGHEGHFFVCSFRLQLGLVA